MRPLDFFAVPKHSAQSLSLFFSLSFFVFLPSCASRDFGGEDTSGSEAQGVVRSISRSDFYDGINLQVEFTRDKNDFIVLKCKGQNVFGSSTTPPCVGGTLSKLAFARFQKSFVYYMENSIRNSIKRVQELEKSPDETMSGRAKRDLEGLRLTLKNSKNCASRFTKMVKDGSVVESLEGSDARDGECNWSDVVWTAASFVYYDGKKSNLPAGEN